VGPGGPVAPGLPAYFLAIFSTSFFILLVKPELLVRPAAKALPTMANTSAITAIAPGAPNLRSVENISYLSS
jgi:hypothetical protein